MYKISSIGLCVLPHNKIYLLCLFLWYQYHLTFSQIAAAVLVWCALGTSGIKLNDSTFVLCLVALNDVEETVQPLVASQDLDESENLLHKSTSTTTSIKGVHLPDKTSFVGEHVQDAVRKALQDNKNCKVLLMPGSSLLQETQTSDREKLGGEVEQNNTGMRQIFCAKEL